MMRPLRVYIAGKITDKDPSKEYANIQRGKRLTEAVLRLGHSPFPVFYTSEWVQRLGLTRHDYYRIDNAWIECGGIDAMVVVPEGKDESEGVKDEIRRAELAGIPVCYGIEDFKDWLFRHHPIEGEDSGSW